jgi:predicted heme/steroid binding protein
MRRTKGLMIAAAMMVLLCVIALAVGCGGDADTESEKTTPADTAPSSTAPDESVKTFTLEELAEFDGEDGQPAYVAVDGVVYDVTGSGDWPAGKHSPCNLDASAGKDLSEILKQAPPAMRGYIEARPVVGELKGD